MKGEELPYAIAREVFYLDSNNRIINLINHRSKDIGDWDIKEYLSSLFEDTLDWVNTHPNLLPSIMGARQLDQMPPIEDNVLIPSLVLASLKRYEEPKSNSSPDPEAA